jgi:hypothetical protein
LRIRTPLTAAMFRDLNRSQNNHHQLRTPAELPRWR